MTAAGARVAGELPAQVGGHPLVARGGRHELRPVGPRDRRDRPFQDRVRRSRGPLHRRLGPRPEPARPAAPTSWRSAAACRLGAPARRRSPTAGSAAAYGGGRLNVRDAIAGELRGLGRASPSMRPAATSTSRGPGPSTRARAAGSRASSSPTTAAGAGARPVVAGRRAAAAPTCRAGPVPTGADAGGPRRAADRVRRRAGGRRDRRRRRRPRGARRRHRLPRRRSRPPGSSRSRRSSRRATGSRCRSAAGRRRGGVFDGVAKSTRQRIRRPRRRSSRVVRHDARVAARRAR